MSEKIFTPFGKWGVNDLPLFSRDRSGRAVYVRGKSFPAWLLIAIPFILLMVFLFERFKELRTTIQWKAALTCVALFEFILIFIEHFSLLKGFWVYNRARILGPEIWGIPIEEPLIYYLFPIVMVIMLWQLIYNRCHKPFKAFWITILAMIPVTILFEYLSLWLDVWSFDLEKAPIWGLVIWGAPIEEFIFWFGAPPFVLTQYLYFSFAYHNHGQGVLNRIAITKYEWEVLALFAAALIINHFTIHLSALDIAVLFTLGILFEVLTHNAWNYNPALEKSPFFIKSIGADWLFGLGWVGNIVTSLAFGTWLAGLVHLQGAWIGVLGVGILGNVWERVFLALGLWTYNPKNWIVTIGTSHPIYSDHGVPLLVTLGYPIMGLGVWHVLKLL